VGASNGRRMSNRLRLLVPQWPQMSTKSAMLALPALLRFARKRRRRTTLTMSLISVTITTTKHVCGVGYSNRYHSWDMKNRVFFVSAVAS
jgi:hypothetical protein